MSSSLYAESSLPPELEERVHAELRSDERLLWVGQPIPKRFARKALPIMLFGIPFLLFSVFWMVMASGMGFGRGFGMMGMLFSLFGLPFVLVGLGMVSSPLWFKNRARKTFYAVTSRRAILWEAGFFGRVEVRSYESNDLEDLHRVEYDNGEGDLVFQEMVTFGRNNRGHQTTHLKQHGMMGIPRVREIEELIRQALIHPSEEK